jgi:uncharacterized protein
MINYIRKNPVLSYFILTFIISWGGIFILGSPYGMPAPSDIFIRMWPIVFIPYLLGPLTAGIVLICLTYGKAGMRELLSNLVRFRVNILWYVIAVLTAPVLVSVILFFLSLISPEYVPAIITAESKAGLLIQGVAIGFFGGGLLEETGWTGMAIPGLRKKHGVLATGLIVGFIWGIWHLLPTFWGSGDSTGKLLLVSSFLPPCVFYIGVLPAYRVLMVWVFERTKSLFIIMLMHAFLTASTVFILAPSTKGVMLIIYYAILTAVMWIIVCVVSKSNSWRAENQQLD